jgi:serine/threonine-protein kinase
MQPSQPTDNATKAEIAARERARALIDRVISDRYRIRELIAMGGMGAVYRGEHLLLKKRIAIKILHPETENLPELVKRFEREAIAGAHIQHPNVATATDFGKLSDGSYFLVLEYVNGKTLAQIIQEGPLPRPSRRPSPFPVPSRLIQEGRPSLAAVAVPFSALWTRRASSAVMKPSSLGS